MAHSVCAFYDPQSCPHYSYPTEITFSAAATHVSHKVIWLPLTHLFPYAISLYTLKLLFLILVVQQENRKDAASGSFYKTTTLEPFQRNVSTY